MKKCKNCGHLNAENTKFCENCGAYLTETKAPEPGKTKECKNCGYLNAENTKFCENCGADLTETKVPELEKTKECKNCGYLNAENTKFCENCGADLIEAKVPEPGKTKECKNCGYLNAENTKFCENCGNPLNKNQPIQINGNNTEVEKINKNSLTPEDSVNESNRRSKKNTKSKKIPAMVASVIVIIIAIIGFVYLKDNNGHTQTAENKSEVTVKKSSTSKKESPSRNSFTSSKSSSSPSRIKTEEVYNEKRDQSNVDVTNLTVSQCLLWALSECYSDQNADEQSWDMLKDSIDSAEVIPATKSDDDYVHIYFNYGSEECNYYIDGNYDLCTEDDDEVVSRYPTEFENEKANNYIMTRYE